ncbi:MAG: protein translocase subunit SecD [Thermoanaerobaculia bacterium]
MNRSLLWRGALILGVVALAALSAFPLRDKINLGLDLRGGIHLRLQVQTEDAVRAETQKAMDRLTDELVDADLPGVSARRAGAAAFEVNGVPADRDAAVDGIVRDFLPGWERERAGEVVRFSMTAQSRSEIEELAVVQALQTIRNRIDEFGVAEPVIQREGLGSDRIVVQLPGVGDPERVKSLIKNTAFLEWRLVRSPGPNEAPTTSREELVASLGGALPEDVEILPSTTRDEQGRELGTVYYALEPATITGRDLRNARPGLGQFNEPVVNFSLSHEGGQRFAALTQANIGRGVAIVLDGNVVSAPRINSRIADSGIIEGGFTQQEAEDLATVLRSGALPAGITYLEESSVSATLGQDSIRQGLRAGVIGGALVVFAVLVVYLLSGVNAVVALALNMLLIFGALAYFGATLTLPGIAGIVLTIGMAVDANVLIFERIREELGHGRTVKSAIDAGFGKALSSILDANITTLIAAVFLFQFGTGPVRGFAVTLSVGILASLFTAIFVSRTLFDAVLTRRQRVERLSI